MIQIEKRDVSCLNSIGQQQTEKRCERKSSALKLNHDKITYIINNVKYITYKKYIIMYLKIYSL